jgi:hypothetical protein
MSSCHPVASAKPPCTRTIVGLAARDGTFIANASAALAIPNGELDESRSHATAAHTTAAKADNRILDDRIEASINRDRVKRYELDRLARPLGAQL